MTKKREWWGLRMGCTCPQTSTSRFSFHGEVHYITRNVQPLSSEENVLALYETVREYGQYPIF